jgi:hypothetical protein
MTREQIQKEIEEMDAYIPVYKIEENLGMPPTTLQKVLKGERELPKKWFKVLDAYFGKGGRNKQEVTPKKEVVEDISSQEIPPIPTREEGEDVWAFAARKNKWKLKYGQK